MTGKEAAKKHFANTNLGRRRTWVRACGLGCALTTVLLTGCVVGPKYRRPVNNVQPFHNAPAIQTRKTTAAAPALDRWWTRFQDPELTKIVQRAVAQNLDLTASLNRVQQARGAAKEAGARLKPSGSIIAQSNSFRQSLQSPVGRIASALPGFDRNQSYLDLGISATWEVDLFGGVRRGAEAATEEVQAAEAGHPWSYTAAPMLAGTLVTVVGLMPVGFARSTAGEYAGNIFWVVAFALLASWFVAVTFTPYLGVQMLP